MLVTPEKRTITGHLQGQHCAMTLDPDALAHLTDLLSRGIYEDAEMAVLREYSLNARDSNDEAGNTDPIEVQLPTTMAPFLKIIDKGIGLNWDDFTNIWSKFGASTKRVAGNTQTGSLGIGSKSGLAYGDQFNVVATKDGIKSFIAVSKTEEGGGDLVLVEEIETDEPNGVEIHIPAKRWNDFSTKANKLFKYWPRGSVTVNGTEVPSITDNPYTERIADDLYMTQNDYGHSVVIMCNVPYPVDNEHFDIELPHNRQILAYVGVDAVDFAGNREKLRMTKKTTDTLTALGQRFRDEMIAAMQAEIDACTSPIGAIRTATKWYLATPEKLRPKDWTYKGAEIPREFAIGEPDENTGRRPYMTVVKQSTSKQSKSDQMQVIPFTSAIKAQWFYGYDLKFTSGHRRRLDEWAKNQRLADPTWEYPEIYVLANVKVTSDYLDPNRIADWDEVRKTKMPNQERADNGRLLGSYDTLTTSSYEHEMLAEDIDDAEPVYYYVGESNKNLRWTRSRTQLAAPYHTLLRSIEPGCTTVLIPGTREAKLLRTFPGAVRVQDAVKGLWQEWHDGLTDDEQTALYIYDATSAHGKLHALDATRIDDPDLVKWVTLVQTSNAATLASQLEKYRNVQRYDSGNYLQLTNTWTDPLERYKLYHDHIMAPSDHLYIYLNAAYAAAQAEAAALVEEMVEEELAA